MYKIILCSPRCAEINAGFFDLDILPWTIILPSRTCSLSVFVSSKFAFKIIFFLSRNGFLSLFLFPPPLSLLMEYYAHVLYR